MEEKETLRQKLGTIVSNFRVIYEGEERTVSLSSSIMLRIADLFEQCADVLADSERAEW